MLPRRDYGTKRNRWTAWIAILLALAVGGGLLWTMQAAFQVGDDMVRSIDATRPQARTRPAPSEPAAAREKKGYVRASPSEAERATAAAPGLRGRVVVPADVPADESAWVELHVPQANPPIVERKRVRPDGSFAFELAKLPSGAEVQLDARYLFLEEPCVITPAESERPIELRPLLGARITGRCELPAELEHLRRELVGASVRFDVVAGPLGAATSVVDSELRFTFDAVEPRATEWVVGSSLPFLQNVGFAGAQLQPGATLTLVLPVGPGRRIAGVVVDVVGAPVPGAKLILAGDAYRYWGSSNTWNRGIGRDETGADGHFELIGLLSGELELHVQREGFVELVHPVPVELPDEPKSDLVLRLAARRSIAGRVLWPDGVPARGATVAADPVAGAASTMRIALADDEGAFEFDGLSDGTYQVSARGSISSDVAEDGTPVAGRSGVAFVGAVAAGTSALELRLDSGVPLRGRVVDASGAPQRAFEIHALPVLGGEAVTLPARRVQGTFQSEDGSFELDGLHPGTWEVRAALFGYRSRRTWVDARAHGGSVELMLECKPVLAGIVRNAEGAPVPDVRVWCDRVGPEGKRVDAWMEISTRTDDGGRFAFASIEPGRILLQARRHPGELARPIPIDLTDDGSRKDVVLVLVPPVDLDGSVVDEAGQPLQHARVTLLPVPYGAAGFESRTKVSDEHGRFQFRALAPGRYELSALLGGRVGCSHTIDLPLPEGPILRLVLPRGAPLSVRFAGSEEERETVDARLLDGAGAEVFPTDDSPVAWSPLEVLRGLVVPGTYRLVLRAENGRAAERALVVRDLEPVEVTIGFDG